MSCHFLLNISIMAGEALLGQKLTQLVCNLIVSFHYPSQNDVSIILSRLASDRCCILSIIGAVRYMCLLNRKVVLSTEMG